MPVSLEGKTVIVVGASSGIGRAIAVAFSREGARVLALARRADRLCDLAREASVETAVMDASDRAQVETVMAGALARYGRVDMMVYATGTNVPGRAMSRLTPENWDLLISTNLTGAFDCTRALLPHMRENRDGLLMYISSVSANVPDVSGAAYQASKRGMGALAHAIRVEEKANGIRTCVICPGLVRTEILDKRPVKTPDEVLALALEPEDVAEAALAVARLHPRVVVPEMEVLPTRL
jgi:NADP-dependent 3-hydroxy acid dehydrogenase YdfG